MDRGHSVKRRTVLRRECASGMWQVPVRSTRPASEDCIFACGCTCRVGAMLCVFVRSTCYLLAKYVFDMTSEGFRCRCKPKRI